MAIAGKQTINIGLPNESTNSDSLYTAFTKTNDNFNLLFEKTTPNVTAGVGISVANAANSTTITNTGVLDIIAGANIIVSNTAGVYTISTGDISSVGTVSSVGVVSANTSRLVSTGGPITTSGNITLDLATVTGLTAGTYSSPVITVDQYGRVISASSGAGSGTVTSVALIPGAGIQVTGGPVTSSGNITVTNTGVTRLTAGAGIALTGTTGNITISSLSASSVGTVTNVDVTSSSLVVTGGPISTAGTINIELPANLLTGGNIAAGNVTANSLIVDGTVSDRDLIYIKQRGTGNVLVIEDTVDPDPTPLVINSDGYIIQGANAVQSFGGGGAVPRMLITGPLGAGQAIYNYINQVNFPPYLILAKSRSLGNTIDAPTNVLDGDRLGRVAFMGYSDTADNPSNFIDGAYVEARVDGTPVGNSLPTKLVFLTNRAGFANPGDRVTINSTGSTIVNATDNTNAAFRVTQTGTGPALLVEDSANPDATPFCVTNNGTVLIGTDEIIDAESKLEVVNNELSIYEFSTGTVPPQLNFRKSSNATIGGHAVVDPGDSVMTITGFGSDGTQFARAGDIIIQVASSPTPGGNSIPSRMLFRVNEVGNTIPTNRQTIHSNGQVSFTNITATEGEELLTNGSAASLLLNASYFSTGASGETATLAAGSTGLIKTFAMRGDGGGNMVITVSNAGWKASGSGTITFDTLGDSCVLQYINSKWFCIGNNGVTFA